tara:strand:- start:553 stop:720 length:168 start_codon:yes stop_codon:yes gene_type:complete
VKEIVAALRPWESVRRPRVGPKRAVEAKPVRKRREIRLLGEFKFEFKFILVNFEA